MATRSTTARSRDAAPRRPRWGALRSSMREAGELTIFAGHGLAALRAAPRYTAEILRQAAILVRGSTLIITLMCFVIGFASMNFAFYVLQAAGASDYTGLFSGLSATRVALPIMFGYVFAAKVGCGLVAEIGSMRINEEIDGYEAEAIDPMRYVVATRIAATALFVPIVVWIGLLALQAGQYVNVVFLLDGLSSSGFLDFHWGIQSLQDQAIAMLNVGTTALTIVLVSCFYGYTVSGGPAAVGTAVARSLVVNLVMVHFIAIGYLTVFYGSDPRLPIGG